MSRDRLAPPRWFIKPVLPVDEPADALVCSADVFLNLRPRRWRVGGGELLHRFGDHTRTELLNHFADMRRCHARTGDIVRTIPPPGCGYDLVLHAVAVDGMFASHPGLIVSVVSECLDKAAEVGARKVALAALGLEGGRLSPELLGLGLRPLLDRPWGGLQHVAVCWPDVKATRRIEAVLRGDRAAMEAALSMLGPKPRHFNPPRPQQPTAPPPM